MSTQVESQVQATTKPDFGKGRYSYLMESVFEDAQAILKMSPKGAEKLARAIATEVGSLMKDANAVVKVGKSLSKDGKVSVSEACKLKGVTLTRNMAILRALDYISSAGKFSIMWSTTSWRFTTSITEYLAEMDSAEE